MTRTTQTPASIARAYIEALGDRRIAEAAAMWEPDGVDNLVGVAVLRGPDEIRDYFTAFLAAVPDLQSEILSVTAQDDRAVVHWRMRGTFNGTGKLLGLAPNGRRFDMLGTDLITVRGGRIVSNVAVTNGLEFARQLAVMPPPNSLAERVAFGLVNLTAAVGKAIRARRLNQERAS